MAGMLNDLPVEPIVEEPVAVPAEGVPPGGVTAAPIEAGAAIEDDDDEPNVSEEDQIAYEEFVTGGMKLLYEGGKPREGILKMLDDDPTDLIGALGEQEGLDAQSFGPIVALGATTAVVVLEVVRNHPEQAAVEGVLLHGGMAILEDIAELATQAGIHEFTAEEVNNATLFALQFYSAGAEAEGLYDPATAEEDMAELQAADQEGRLFDMVPQLKQFSGGDA